MTEAWRPWRGEPLEKGWPVRVAVSERPGTVEYHQDRAVFVRWESDEEFVYGYTYDGEREPWLLALARDGE